MHSGALVPGSRTEKFSSDLRSRSGHRRPGTTGIWFGQSWSDDVDVDGGHNGYDTRNDVLRRDLTAIVATERSGGCVVTTGVLADPCTGDSISFTRGEDTSSAVQIDHVVALSDAWQKGAQQLDADTLRNFANDPRNLQAVDGPTNSAKGDGDAATWLPPNNDYRCTYVARQVEVKAEYRLWVTDAEYDAITRVLTSCGGGAAVLESTAVVPEPAPMVEEAPVIEQAFVPAPEPVQVYTPEPVAPAPALQAGPDNSSSAGGGGGSCGTDSYIDSAGNCVHAPASAVGAGRGDRTVLGWHLLVLAEPPRNVFGPRRRRGLALNTTRKQQHRLSHGRQSEPPDGLRDSHRQPYRAR